ncbi:MAG: SDR family NAD(P)-dependent oxidoreductase, partial [Oscillospiraceae bacterium]
MMLNLEGKNAIVTGATRGIGKAIALKLGSLGANVAILCVGSQEDADAACEELRAMGRKAEFYRCNVASMEETKAAVKAVIGEFGSVDILVNNAGITRDGLVLSMKEEDFDAVLNINLKGAFHMIKACYSGFIRR